MRVPGPHRKWGADHMCPVPAGLRARLEGSPHALPGTRPELPTLAPRRSPTICLLRQPPGQGFGAKRPTATAVAVIPGPQPASLPLQSQLSPLLPIPGALGRSPESHVVAQGGQAAATFHLRASLPLGSGPTLPSRGRPPACTAPRSQRLPTRQPPSSCPTAHSNLLSPLCALHLSSKPWGSSPHPWEMLSHRPMVTGSPDQSPFCPIFLSHLPPCTCPGLCCPPSPPLSDATAPQAPSRPFMFAPQPLPRSHPYIQLPT